MNSTALISGVVLPLPPAGVLSGQIEAWRCWSHDVLMAMAQQDAIRTSGSVRVTIGLPQSSPSSQGKLLVNAVLAFLVGEKIVESRECIADVCVRLIADLGLRLDVTRWELSELMSEDEEI